MIVTIFGDKIIAKGIWWVASIRGLLVIRIIVVALCLILIPQGKDCFKSVYWISEGTAAFILMHRHYTNTANKINVTIHISADPCTMVTYEHLL